MGFSAFRRLVLYVLLPGIPSSLFAADSSAAMLYTHGAAWLNGSHVPASSAIFSGDLLQTRSDSGANINAAGSSITVLGDSLIRFEGTSLNLQHGGIGVATSKAVATIAGGIRVAPTSNVWTEFNVTDVDGTVRIAAKKGDLTVTDDTGTVMLAQGQETTRDAQSDQGGSSGSSDKSDKKKNQKQDQGAQPAAHGGMLNSTIAVAAGAAAVAGVAVWAVTRSSSPVSPSTP